MSDLEKKLAKSLTAETTDLIPYLPYLLQDLWELGSSPEDIKELIKNNIQMSQETKVLDLACGKGAVGVQLARAFGCKVKGIDIMPEFIEYAKKMAGEYSVETICQFVVEDIKQSVRDERDYDIVIFGAAGDVLGSPAETLSRLKGTVKKGGYIFIDDAYIVDGLDETYLSREQWLQVFNGAGVRLVAEKAIDHRELVEINRINQARIIRRSSELMALYAEKRDIFEGYIKSQQSECDQLECEITGVTLLLQVN